MKLGVEVSWKNDVFPCWRRSANNAPRPNSDVWGPLPRGVRWYEAELEDADLPQLYLIGSSDLQETFGTYRVADVSPDMSGEDRYHHHVRVRCLLQALREDCVRERPIVISNPDLDQVVILDGNHRCLAHQCRGSLPGLPIYLGVATRLLEKWGAATGFRPAR